MDPGDLIRMSQQRDLERQKLLAKPDDLANLVADKVESFLPGVAKPSAKFATRLEAVEKLTPGDHPLASLPRELYERTYAKLQNPGEDSWKSPYQILNELAVDSIVRPSADNPRKSRLERAYEYKRAADASWFGIGGEAENVKPPLGYATWLGDKRAEEGRRPAEDWLSSWGDLSAAVGIGGAIGGAVGMYTGGPAAAGVSALTAAAAMVPMELIGHPIRKLLHETEWYRSKEESTSYLDKAKLLAMDLLPDLAVGYAAPGVSRRLAVEAGKRGLAEATGTRMRLATGGQTLPQSVGSLFPEQERAALGIVDPVARAGISTGIGDVMPLYGGLVSKGDITAQFAKVTSAVQKAKAAEDLLNRAGTALQNAPTGENLLEVGRATQLARLNKIKAETILDDAVGREETFDLYSAFEKHVDARARAAGIEDPRIAGIRKPFSLLSERPPTGGPTVPPGGVPPVTPGVPPSRMPPPQVFRGGPTGPGAKARTINDTLAQIKAAQQKAFGGRVAQEVDGRTAFSQLDDEAAEHALQVAEGGVPIAEASNTALKMQETIRRVDQYDKIWGAPAAGETAARSVGLLEKEAAARDAKLMSMWKERQAAQEKAAALRAKYSSQVAGATPATAPKVVNAAKAIQEAHEARVAKLGAQGLEMTPQESSQAIKEMERFYEDLEINAHAGEVSYIPRRETMTQKEAIEQEKGTLNAVKEWLLGRGDTPPAPTRIYRGILKGNVPTASPEGEYMAGSPWPQIAGRGGKGAMGDYRSHNLHSYPAGEDTLYYRGGALAGDPLEQTLINSASGMTWNQLLERAKEAYPKLVAKEMKNLKRDLPDPEMQKLWSEEIPSNVADRITSALRMASFETDVFGKPGIWAGKELPKKLAGETPKLRSYKELERVVAKARKAGMSEEDIAQLPESQILARRMDKNPTPGPLGVDVASEVEGPKSLGAMALDSEEFLAAVRRRNVEKDGSIWQHGQRVRPTDENIAINIASAERNMAEKQVIIDNLSKLPVDADVTTVRKYLANDTRIVTRDEGIAIFSGLNRQSAKYIEDMKLANATEKSRKESGLLGLIPAFLVGAAGIGAAILGPSDAEAGVIDGAMGTVSKSVFNWLKTARGLGTEIEPLIKTVDAMHLNAVPVNPANPYTAPRAMEGLSLAPAATQALGATKEAIARTSKFFLGLNRFMTPYTVGEIYYKPGFNPAVELASRQEAWMKNTSIRGQVAANILDAVPGYRASQAEGRKAIIDAFEPLAKRHAEDVGVYRTLEMREATLGEYLTAMGKKKNPGEKIRNGIAKAQEELESIAITKKQLQPNVQEFQAETTAMYDRLSKQYPGVRLSLAAEDTADFQHYPFLKGRLSFDERTAVARIKDLMLDYGQRIKDAKLDTITERPFIHHGWHPAWSEANVAKRLADLDLSMANALPYSKFFRRSQYSMQMVPEVAYNLERYIPDAEKRIQMAKFWDKGNPSGWWRHASSTQVQGSEPLRNFWQLIRDSAVPSTVTTGNQWMNRYAMFESLRLIGYAPSVAFKHLFKQMGTFSSLGVRETLSTAPVSGGVALRNYLRQNVHPDVLRSIGLVGDRDVNKGLDEFVNSFVRQNRMQNILQDLDLRPYGNSVPDQVLNRLATNSGLLVGMVESFDRANSVMASILMAQKAGMTGQQAVYSIYDTILKNNFLGGVMNASWMKDPWIRGLFLFQSTPFKIAERRLVQAYKTGKSLGKVWDVIPGANALQKLEQLAGVKNFVKQGEDEFKKKMILGALTSEKDTFGTPVSKQFMKEMVMAGLVLGAGGAMGLDLSPQVGHFPFLKPTSHDPALSVSPILSSAFQVMGDRGKAAREGEDPQFFVTNFLQNWIGGEGYVPLTAHKLMRISNDDVPETYKGSGLQYLFSVPSKKGQ